MSENIKDILLALFLAAVFTILGLSYFDILI